MTKEFSAEMLKGDGTSSQWKQMAAMNAIGVQTNKVSRHQVKKI